MTDSDETPNPPEESVAPDTADTSEASDSAEESDHSDTNQDHTNRLIAETSPYLLQHAHNPVDWYAWGMRAV